MGSAVVYVNVILLVSAVFAVEGFVHVNVLHDRRTVFDTRENSKSL